MTQSATIKKLNIFIGYDDVERVTWHTLVDSIIEHSSIPVSVTPVHLGHFGSFFNRERDEKQSNSFSFSRFLVPYLMDYQGHALFMDSDMMLRTDVAELVHNCSNHEKALHVVQHDYTPQNTIKYLGNVQHAYPRKNWSSFVLWNCAHKKNKILTPQYVERASGLQLHRFTWLDDDEIGALEKEWNWLVGEYDLEKQNIKNVHWTIGGPYFHDYAEADFATEWRRHHTRINYCKQKN